MNKKVALITGITGQDGSYLAELLLEKEYEVYGIIRRSSTFNTGRIDHIRNQLKLIYGDLTDQGSILSIIKECQPDEIYNLAAQSHVAVSFQLESYSAQVNSIGVLNILQSIKLLNLEKKVKFYQASTSEMYGNALTDINSNISLNENVELKPVSPYAIAKLYSHLLVKYYREAYGIFASSSIVFNHESSRRGDNFVTKKIIRWIKYELPNNIPLHIGNLDASRDWSHAKDIVYGIYLIMQHNIPDDFVLASGIQVSVRSFIEKSLQKVNKTIIWHGSGENEKGYDSITNQLLVIVDPKYFRPNELYHLKGDSTKARNILGWNPTYNLDSLIDEMLLNS